MHPVKQTLNTHTHTHTHTPLKSKFLTCFTHSLQGPVDLAICYFCLSLWPVGLPSWQVRFLLQDLHSHCALSPDMQDLTPFFLYKTDPLSLVLFEMSAPNRHLTVAHPLLDPLQLNWILLLFFLI